MRGQPRPTIRPRKLGLHLLEAYSYTKVQIVGERFAPTDKLVKNAT